MFTTVGLLDENTNVDKYFVQQYFIPIVSFKSPLNIIYFSKANVDSLPVWILNGQAYWTAPLLRDAISERQRKLSSHGRAPQAHSGSLRLQDLSYNCPSGFDVG